ncbi:MAG: hypothetical protein P1T08_16290 [Acidimicrobiia bacterium]|nr:hypothetical protein [Acidimicrobiia bacterium]
MAAVRYPPPLIDDATRTIPSHNALWPARQFARANHDALVQTAPDPFYGVVRGITDPHRAFDQHDGVSCPPADRPTTDGAIPVDHADSYSDPAPCAVTYATDTHHA